MNPKKPAIPHLCQEAIAFRYTAGESIASLAKDYGYSVEETERAIRITLGYLLRSYLERDAARDAANDLTRRLESELGKARGELDAAEQHVKILREHAEASREGKRPDAKPRLTAALNRQYEDDLIREVAECALRAEDLGRVADEHPDRELEWAKKRVSEVAAQNELGRRVRALASYRRRSSSGAPSAPAASEPALCGVMHSDAWAASEVEALRPSLCGIASFTRGTCDLEWGHDDNMHSSQGVGFFVLPETEHERRQAERTAASELDAALVSPPPAESATEEGGTPT